MQEKLRLDYNFLNSYLKLFNATAEFEQRYTLQGPDQNTTYFKSL